MLELILACPSICKGERKYMIKLIPIQKIKIINVDFMEEDGSKLHRDK